MDTKPLSSYKRRRILEVAGWRSITDFTCTGCGVIQRVNEVTLREVTWADHRIHVRASCNSCGKFLRYMPTNALPRVFHFESKSMIYVTEAETSLLRYYLGETKNANLRASILHELNHRNELEQADLVDPLPPDDISPNQMKIDF